MYSRCMWRRLGEDFFEASGRRGCHGVPGAGSRMWPARGSHPLLRAQRGGGCWVAGCADTIPVHLGLQDCGKMRGPGLVHGGIWETGRRAIAMCLLSSRWFFHGGICGEGGGEEEFNWQCLLVKRKAGRRLSSPRWTLYSQFTVITAGHSWSLWSPLVTHHYHQLLHSPVLLPLYPAPSASASYYQHCNITLITITLDSRTCWRAERNKRSSPYRPNLPRDLNSAFRLFNLPDTRSKPATPTRTEPRSSHVDQTCGTLYALLNTNDGPLPRCPAALSCCLAAQMTGRFAALPLAALFSPAPTTVLWALHRSLLWVSGTILQCHRLPYARKVVRSPAGGR